MNGSQQQELISADTALVKRFAQQLLQVEKTKLGEAIGKTTRDEAWTKAKEEAFGLARRADCAETLMDILFLEHDELWLRIPEEVRLAAQGILVAAVMSLAMKPYLPPEQFDILYAPVALLVPLSILQQQA